MEISSCCKYPAPRINVYGTRGGLSGDTRRLEWQCFDPATAPALELTTTPIQKADGTPAYCSDALEWRKEEWTAPEGPGHYPSHGSRLLRDAPPIADRGRAPGDHAAAVRQQIAVIEEAQRQNPHIYPGRA